MFCAIYATSAIPDGNTTATNLCPQYTKFVDVFEKKNVDGFSKHRSYDCAIDIQDGAQLPFRPIYNLSQNELAELRPYIDEKSIEEFHLSFKVTYWSTYTVYQKERWFLVCVCVDYQGLNKVIIKN